MMKLRNERYSRRLDHRLEKGVRASSFIVVSLPIVVIEELNYSTNFLHRGHVEGCKHTIVAVSAKFETAHVVSSRSGKLVHDVVVKAGHYLDLKQNCSGGIVNAKPVGNVDASHVE